MPIIVSVGTELIQIDAGQYIDKICKIISVSHSLRVSSDTVLTLTQKNFTFVRYKTGQILLLDVKKGGIIVSRLRGHDVEVFSVVWCPIPGENFKPAQTSQDITDLETFGVGK